jgi:hypothetical protein
MTNHMYVYCAYPAMSKSPKQLPNYLKIVETICICLKYKSMPFVIWRVWSWFTITIVIDPVEAVISHKLLLTEILLKVLYTHLQGIGICDLSRFCLSCVGPLVFLLPKTFNLFGFQIFWLWTHQKHDYIFKINYIL